MHTPRSLRPLVLGPASVLGAATLVLATAAGASAHITVDSDTTSPGDHAVLTFSVPHGCQDSATTELAIQLPEGIDSATPTRNSFYTVETVTEELESPTTDSHGEEVSERVSEVVYTASTPLPANQRDAIELSVQLPEDPPEDPLYFPAVQTCEDGESAWVQIPSEGQDLHDLELPAPALDLSAADATTEGHTGAEAEQDAPAGQEQSDPEQAPSALTALALVIGGLGLLTAVIALALGRRRP